MNASDSSLKNSKLGVHLSESASEATGSSMEPEGPELSTPTKPTTHSFADGDLPPPPSEQKIGRYTVRRPLGAGAFGAVYVCYDELADRLVAVKVIDESKLAGQSPDEYLAEARALAKLDHAAIVPVYDVGRTSEGQAYVVTKFVPKGDLKSNLKKESWTLLRTSAAIADLAEALDHAHQRGIVHRDVKPANILLDDDGRVYLADFGIALLDSIQGGNPVFAGTVPYMSPEQACGEGHRLDGRSDIFSLGTVFYEVALGRRLFPGNEKRSLVSRIARFDPEDLGELGHSLPIDLDRILRKALAPRAMQRYPTAALLAADLRAWIAGQVRDASGARSGQPQLAVTVGPGEKSPKLESGPAALHPRGLRSFQASDAAVFLDLLPGPRDAAGLPELVQFWLDRLDPNRGDPDAEPLAVGVIYGPSGSGKSSLAAAGILPRLSNRDVRVLSVECAPEGTADRIARALARMEESTDSSANLSSDGGSLPESFARIRRSGFKAKKRLLLVLDQFEQWLRTWDGAADDPIVLALRQCDGHRLQALAIVRDDFWSSTNRLMQVLEQPFAEGKTATNVGGFSPRHARRVLARLGSAYGAIDAASSTAHDSEGDQFPTESEQFIRLAVDQLKSDGTVLPVQLALFVEAVKELPWTPATLRTIGGVDGAARYFLDATFGPSAPVGQRRHRQAAVRTLERLLPQDASIDLKGAQQNAEELSAAAGYGAGTGEARDLFDLLENRLRLITAVESAKIASGTSDPTTPSAQYQLTHDYLVHPLKAWIDQDQSRSLRGRLERRIDELSRAWSVAPEARNLPPWWQWPPIALAYAAARPEFKTPTRNAFIQTANRRVGTGFLSIAAVFALLAWIGRDYHGRLQASAAVANLISAKTEVLPYAVSELEPWRPWVNSILQRKSAQLASPPASLADVQAAMRIHLALADDNATYIPSLINDLVVADAAEVAAMQDTFVKHHAVSLPLVQERISRTDIPGHQLRLAVVLAKLDPSDERLKGLLGELAVVICRDPVSLARPWVDLLEPAHPLFVDDLRGHANRSSNDPFGETAAMFLARCLRDQPAQLSAEVNTASERQFRFFVDALRPHGLAAFKPPQWLKASMVAPTEPFKRIADAQRRANVVAALTALGDSSALQDLASNVADPNARTKFIRTYANAGMPLVRLVEVLESTSTSNDVRYVAILSLAKQLRLGIEPSIKVRLTDVLTELYDRNPDSGIHGAAGWLLGLIGEGAIVERLDAKHGIEDQKLLASGRFPARNWFVADDGQVMAIVRSTEIRVVDPKLVGDKPPVPRTLRCNYDFAISLKEVSSKQLLRYFPNVYDKRVGVWNREEAARFVDFQRVLGYPEVLNQLARIPPEQRVLPDVSKLMDKKIQGFLPKELNVSQTPCYRLPTQTEWEIACRAGAVTNWSFGDDLLDADFYANFQTAVPVKSLAPGQRAPNRAGLFDMHGNLMEYVLPSPWSRVGVNGPYNFFFRGGNFGSGPDGHATWKSFPMCVPCGSNLLDTLAGFRIARTIVRKN